MTKDWDELDQKERKLSEQLEEMSHRRFRVEQILRDFEDYDRSLYFSENDLWEASLGSRYAYQLEERNQELQYHRRQMFNDFCDCIDSLKKEERQIEDDIEAIYYKKRKENLK